MTPTSLAFKGAIDGATSADALDAVVAVLPADSATELADAIAEKRSSFTVTIADASAAEILAARPDIAELFKTEDAAPDAAVVEARDKALADVETLTAKVAELTAAADAAGAEAGESAPDPAADAALETLRAAAAETGVADAAEATLASLAEMAADALRASHKTHKPVEDVSDRDMYLSV